MNDHWQGLQPSTRNALNQRDYTLKSVGERLGTTGVDAGELVAGKSVAPDAWIPGVEIFARKIFLQRHRGFFGEFGRKGEGRLGEIGFWPQQWATARMFATTAKGFHIHPPHIPAGEKPDAWFQKLFLSAEPNYALRPYEQEQWDVMFFVQGNVEMILVDERAGLPRRVMRFIVDGDDQRGANNIGLVIPPGVAHALRAEGSRDAIMVYGTSTKFNPDFEGRIADDVERAPLPEAWTKYIQGPA